MVDLAANANDWNRHFRQTTDIDMNALPKADACIIGNEDIPFSGIFDGGGHTLANLLATDPGANGVGLFGQIRSYTAEIRNVVLLDPHVDAVEGQYVGALVGRLRSGAVTNCRAVRARVLGHMGVGGLIGWSQGAIQSCTVTGTVSGGNCVGGLTGVTFWCDDIRDCRADVTVTGQQRVGGLVGDCALASIRWCSAGGRVDGQTYVGGLVGSCAGGLLANSYAAATVTGAEAVGGLLGRNTLSCDCSAGALPGEVMNCYSIGLVRGTVSAGGLVGQNDECIVERAFWDMETSGLTDSAGGTGLDTAAMQSPQTFAQAHWDLTVRSASKHYWVMCATPAYPILAWQIIPGDADKDGDVDLHDFSELARRWSGPRSCLWDADGDQKSDARVGFGDLNTLSQHWLLGRYP